MGLPTVGCDVERMLCLLLQDATQETLLQLWLNGRIAFFSCSLPVEFRSIGCLQITGVRNAIGAVEVKSGDAGWGCLANNNGCGRRSRSGVRKAATKSYGA